MDQKGVDLSAPWTSLVAVVQVVLQQVTPAYHAWVCKGAQVAPWIAWDLAQGTVLEEDLEEVH